MKLSIEGFGSEQNTGKSGFAGPVRTDQCNPVSSFDLERSCTLKHLDISVFARIRLRKLRYFEQDPTCARGILESKCNRGIIGRGRRQTLETVQHFYPALHLTCFGSLGPESFDKSFGLLDILLLIYIRCTVHGTSLDTIHQVKSIIAGVFRKIPLRHFNDTCHHSIEKISIMRNDDYGSGE